MSSSSALPTSLIKHIFVHLCAISPQKNCLTLFREQNTFRKKPLHLLTFHQLPLTFGMNNFSINSFCMNFDSFFMGASQKFPRCSKNKSFERFSWKITIPTLRDIVVPTNWNDYRFFSMTQKVLEIDVMVYNMTKNPKIYKKTFLVTVLEN